MIQFLYNFICPSINFDLYRQQIRFACENIQLSIWNILHFCHLIFPQIFYFLSLLVPGTAVVNDDIGGWVGAKVIIILVWGAKVILVWVSRSLTKICFFLVFFHICDSHHLGKVWLITGFLYVSKVGRRREKERRKMRGRK